MQAASPPQTSEVSFARAVGFASPFIGSVGDTDASWNWVSGVVVGAATADVVSATGGSIADAGVSAGSGSGVTVLPTDDMAEDAGSVSLRSTPTSAATEATALPGVPASASSAVGVGAPNAVPHTIAHA